MISFKPLQALSKLRRISTAASPFTAPKNLPFRAIATISHSPVLIVAPHPDDETLGCGGAIALLRSGGYEVKVLVISDGTKSHPNSQKYPPPMLQTLRQQEALSGTAILGVSTDAVQFLGLKDGDIPTVDAAGFAPAIARCCDYFAAVAPQTIFLPWRHDPHPDHRATWELAQAALQQLSLSPRLIEYPIWDWDPEQRSDSFSIDTITAWRLDIREVVDLKQRAIAAYRSQITNLIDDDPEGFCLTSEMLANFQRPWEVYFEEVR